MVSITNYSEINRHESQPGGLRVTCDVMCLARNLARTVTRSTLYKILYDQDKASNAVVLV